MNFIVGRMIISDMRTSCDQYSLLQGDAAKTRAVGEMWRKARSRVRQPTDGFSTAPWF
jgi:hypothetical protein